MNCNHNPLTERGETYCRTCGEVFGVDIVSSFQKRKYDYRFLNRREL